MDGEERSPTDHAATVAKAIRRIVRAFDLRSKQVARETGLTLPQIVVLRAAAELGEVTTAALSRHVDLSAATVVTILEKLESRGFVTRRRSAVDRRIVHTALTERGAAVLASAPYMMDARFMSGFAALPEQERRAIAGAFAMVADLLDAEPGRGGRTSRRDAGPMMEIEDDRGGTGGLDDLDRL